MRAVKIVLGVTHSGVCYTPAMRWPLLKALATDWRIYLVLATFAYVAWAW